MIPERIAVLRRFTAEPRIGGLKYIRCRNHSKGNIRERIEVLAGKSFIPTKFLTFPIVSNSAHGQIS